MAARRREKKGVDNVDTLERPTSRLPADPRAALAAIAHQHGHSLAALSRMLRRRERYLDGFVREACQRR